MGIRDAMERERRRQDFEAEFVLRCMVQDLFTPGPGASSGVTDRAKHYRKIAEETFKVLAEAWVGSEPKIGG